MSQAKSNYWDNLLETDEHAASYMETYGEGIGTKVRMEIGKYLNPEEWVLDVGCGPGWNFDTFLQHGPSVYYRGMDYSERFVRVANQRVAPMQIFKKGDVRKIPEPDRSFDVVIFQDVLEHTNGFEKPVREALRVARKRVIITFWHLDNSDTPHINDDGDDGWGAWYDKREWEKFLTTLRYRWEHHSFEFPEGRNRDLYVIRKEKK